MTWGRSNNWVLILDSSDFHCSTAKCWGGHPGSQRVIGVHTMYNWWLIYQRNSHDLIDGGLWNFEVTMATVCSVGWSVLPKSGSNILEYYHVLVRWRFCYWAGTCNWRLFGTSVICSKWLSLGTPSVLLQNQKWVYISINKQLQLKRQVRVSKHDRPSQHHNFQPSQEFLWKAWGIS